MRCRLLTVGHSIDLESIRYNCHFETITGSAFNIAPSRIFTSVLLPSSMSLSTPGAGGSGVNLPLVIALPIIGFVIILIGLGVCCFFFIRWRRKRTRRGRHQSHMWGLPGRNQQSWAAEEMYAAGFGGGVSHGLGFVDTDGRGHEVGYGYDYSDQPSASQPFPQQYADHTSYSNYPKAGFEHQISEDIPLQSPPIPQPYTMQGGLQQYDPDQKRPL